MKITWALIVQRRTQHARARELDDTQFRPVANRLRDFLEQYLEAPPQTVSVRVTSAGGRYGTLDFSFAGEEAVVAVTIRHDGAGVVEAMVDHDEWFDLGSQNAHVGLEAICERVARMLLRPDVV
jgi:hypothetical protein